MTVIAHDMLEIHRISCVCTSYAVLFIMALRDHTGTYSSIHTYPRTHLVYIPDVEELLLGIGSRYENNQQSLVVEIIRRYGFMFLG